MQEKEHKDDFAKNCLDKLRSGQIDVMPWVDDTTETRNYADVQKVGNVKGMGMQILEFQRKANLHPESMNLNLPFYHKMIMQ